MVLTMCCTSNRFDEFGGQPIEEFGVGGRVAGANVVKRLDDSDAE